MKIESQIQIASETSSFELYPDGSESAALFANGRKVLSIGRIRTGNFDEALGLAEKLRRHMANDTLSAEAESENVIPFGCEYRVKRQWKFAGNTGELTDDIAADNGGKIDDLSLEEIFFAGEAVGVNMLFAGEKEMQKKPISPVIYDGSDLPMAVQVIFADGVRAEFYCGDDLWRHNCAALSPGAVSRHLITAEASGIRWVRHILSLPEDAVAEKRPWRFKALFAVSAAANDLPGEADLVIDGCFAAASAHRDFRSFIRKQEENSTPVVRISEENCCEDGSHVSRPGKKVLHGMLGEIFDEYIWSNTVMARKGGSCRIVTDIRGLDGSVIAGNLALVPGEMSFPDREEL